MHPFPRYLGQKIPLWMQSVWYESQITPCRGGLRCLAKAVYPLQGKKTLSPVKAAIPVIKSEAALKKKWPASAKIFCIGGPFSVMNQSRPGIGYPYSTKHSKEPRSVLHPQAWLKLVSGSHSSIPPQEYQSWPPAVVHTLV